MSAFSPPYPNSVKGWLGRLKTLSPEVVGVRHPFMGSAMIVIVVTRIWVWADFLRLHSWKSFLQFIPRCCQTRRWFWLVPNSCTHCNYICNSVINFATIDTTLQITAKNDDVPFAYSRLHNNYANIVILVEIRRCGLSADDVAFDVPADDADDGGGSSRSLTYMQVMTTIFTCVSCDTHFWYIEIAFSAEGGY